MIHFSVIIAYAPMHYNNKFINKPILLERCTTLASFWIQMCMCVWGRLDRKYGKSFGVKTTRVSEITTTTTTNWVEANILRDGKKANDRKNMVMPRHTLTHSHKLRFCSISLDFNAIAAVHCLFQSHRQQRNYSPT